MPLNKDEKSTIMTDFAQHEGDTGSAQVQIALLTRRIHQLTDHLREHKQDQSSRRGLLKLVGQRRRHLRYLSKTDPALYQSMLQRLGLRR